MRKINKLLRYKFTEKERKSLMEKKVTNGCGISDGFNFSDFFSRVIDAVKEMSSFDSTKYSRLLNDWSILCCEHDVDCERGGSKIRFVRITFCFCYSSVRLLHRFGKLWQKVVLFIFMFYTMLKHSHKAFKFGERIPIKEFKRKHLTNI